jgi:rubrerythrin
MEETQKEEMWNFKCSHCEWRGVAQELIWMESEADYVCPICSRADPRQVEWHQGDKPLIKIKRHI